MNVLLLGMSHRTAPVELRERFATADLRGPLGKLVAGPEVDEAVLLSTCNRVEVVAATRQPEAAALRLRRFVEHELGGSASPAELDEALYEYRGPNAIRHVFRVTCSVDSMVVGEPQILGQVKEAYREAVACGACGPVLGRLYQRAFAAAKRVRAETRIAERPVSVARVAVELARQIFESLADKTALLVGAGEMTEHALSALRAEGLAAVRVANRTRARAAELADRFDATAHGLAELPELLPTADVVLTQVAGEGPLLGREALEAALRRRHHRPVFVIDLGVPRNVDPAANALESLYLYDVDDLGGVAAENAEERRREVIRAEAIVLEEQQRFDGWLAALEAVPTIRHLRARAEAMRRSELERALGRLALGEEERDAVERMSRALVNKILHAPVARLRQEGDREESLALREAARALFALDDPRAPGADADPDADAEAYAGADDASAKPDADAEGEGGA